MVLKHEAGSPALCGYVNATRAVVQDLAVENHSAFHLIQPRQRSQQSGLARPVGTQHCDRLVSGGGQLDVKREAVAADSHPGLEAHSAPTHPSPMPTTIPTQPTPKMTLTVLAA